MAVRQHQSHDSGHCWVQVDGAKLGQLGLPDEASARALADRLAACQLQVMS
jgi:hypothetical protein